MTKDEKPTGDEEETKDRRFAVAEYYTNLFGWLNANGEKQTPALDLIKEIKHAILTPNPEFEQLKKDMESLSCGKKVD
jgi:hypothetical protein